MPREHDNNMASLIQRVARQACLTFRGGGRAGPRPKGFPEQLSKLRGLLSQVRAEDLNIAPRLASPQPPKAPHLPPVTYMHILETAGFSLGVFLLKSGTSIPLHDHPGMHGMLKVLYGTVRISCLDVLDDEEEEEEEKEDRDGGHRRLHPEPRRARAPPPGLHFEPPLQPHERRALRAGVLRSRAEYTEASGPCVLSPRQDNLHQIDAVDGPAAFLDILAPPYDPDQGRDCHYYRVLEAARPREAAAAGTTTTTTTTTGTQGSGSDHCDRDLPLPREVWLLETPQAEDFWCEGEPYPGPKVSP